MSNEPEFLLVGVLFGVIIGVMVTALFVAGSGAWNYNGIQTIHVTDKYPCGSGTFAIVTCDQVYYTSDPLVVSKIVENGTYNVKFSNNPLTHYSMLTDIISGDSKPSGCN